MTTIFDRKFDVEDAEVSLAVHGTGDGEGGEVDVVGFQPFDKFLSYSFNTNFLTPTDGWSFTVASERLSDKQKAAVVPGSEVSLIIHGNTQNTGIVDKLAANSSRSGTTWTIEGRDMLSPAVDAVLDPQVRYTPEMSLEQMLVATFTPYGWNAPETDFRTDNEENRNVITGGRKDPLRKKALPAASPSHISKFRLRDRKLHQLKPYPHEGVFTFASRVAQRFGLWIWCSADATHLIVGKPDFNQKPLYFLINNRQESNILKASASHERQDQPSLIIASGYGTGGEFQRDHFTRGMLNPLFNTNAQIEEVAADWPKTVFIEYKDGFSFPEGSKFKENKSRCRPLFLRDDESKTHEQLENFLRREMALRLRKSLTYRATVPGHLQNGIPWATDTVVSVEDDFCNVRENMWVLDRTFRKDRGGTFTDLELIRLNSLAF